MKLVLSNLWSSISPRGIAELTLHLFIYIDLFHHSLCWWFLRCRTCRSWHWYYNIVNTLLARPLRSRATDASASKSAGSSALSPFSSRLYLKKRENKEKMIHRCEWVEWMTRAESKEKESITFSPLFLYNLNAWYSAYSITGGIHIKLIIIISSRWDACSVRIRN